MNYLLARLLILVCAVMLVPYVIPGVAVASVYTALIVAVILGVLNVTIKPLLVLLTLPITLLTFGLFTLVINALLFWFVASFVQGFEVSDFGAAFLGALLVSVVNWIGVRLIK